MVKIVDGIGRSVQCKWCNHALTLSSATDYCKCVNCGGRYDDPLDKPIKVKSHYNWYYLIFKLLNIQ